MIGSISVFTIFIIVMISYNDHRRFIKIITHQYEQQLLTITRIMADNIARGINYQTDAIEKKSIEDILKPIATGPGRDAYLLDETGKILTNQDIKLVGTDIFTALKEQYPGADLSLLKKFISEAVKGKERASSIDMPPFGKKLVSSAPILLKNRTWSLCIIAEYSDITGLILKHFKSVFGFAFIIGLVITMLSAFLYKAQKKKKELQIEANCLNSISECSSALQETEEKLEGILSATTDYMFIVDEDLNIIWANIVAKELFGHEAIGKPCYIACRQRRSGCEQCNAQLVLDDGQPHANFMEMLAIDGRMRRFWCSASIVPPHKNGRPRRIAMIGRDVTDQKKTEDEIQEVRLELEKKNEQLSQLSQKLIHVQEWDRQQVSMELHDHIGQVLTIIKMELERHAEAAEITLSRLRAKARATVKELGNAIREIKTICHKLRPSTIDNIGLIPSLKNLIEDIEVCSDVKIDLFIKDIPARFEPEKEIAIYRLVQEALTNIIRYAQAENIFISLLLRDASISLSIEDDGVGFDVQEIIDQASSTGKGLGLMIMQERAHQLNGECSIESSRGKGTHVLVEIPL
ncbi:MAG: ATP-binding protein [Pseudomonadota bacterium]